MQTSAAILWEQSAPLAVEPVELAPPGPGELLVEVRTAGVCHSDLHPARGDWPMRTPVVLGHEGAGVVLETGPGVTRAAPGDHVVFCWAPACGACTPCLDGRAVLCDRLDRTTYRNRLPSGDTRLSARGQRVAHFLSTACFARHAVVAEEGAVVVPRHVPFDVLAVLGCAVVTGVGAVLNTGVPAGARIAVIGAGGVGLNVVQGGIIAGCEQIVAVDREAPALALASTFGATATVHAAGDEPSRVVRDLTGGWGVDYAFDTVATPATLAVALASVRKGGTVIVTGLSRVDGQGAIPLFPFVMQEKRLVGSVYGSGNPVRDIPHLIALHESGRLKLRELVARTYRLDEVNDALAALAGGAGGRGVLVMDGGHGRA